MKFDKQIMRPTLIWVISSVVLSLVVGLGSMFIYSSSTSDYALQESALSTARQRSTKISEDLTVLNNSLPRFKTLEQKGLIGEEHRLDWVETLRDVANELKLNKFEYRINEQKPFEGTDFTAEGNYQIFTSDMHLSMQLLHEGDFLKIMDELRSKAEGLFHVNKCEFNRIQKSLVIDAKTPNINAECNIQWFSIKYQQQNNEVGV